MGENKKAVSQIITTVLIIAIVLLLILVVWIVVRTVINRQASQIDVNTVNLEIESVKLNCPSCQESLPSTSFFGKIYNKIKNFIIPN